MEDAAKENITEDKRKTTSTDLSLPEDGVSTMTLKSASPSGCEQFAETILTTTKATTPEKLEEKTFSSDSTITSSEPELITDASKTADELKESENVSQNTMNQILKAHCEQVTTTARVEVEVAGLTPGVVDIATTPVSPKNLTATTVSSNPSNSEKSAALEAAAAIAAIDNVVAAAENPINISIASVMPSINEVVDAAVSAPNTGELDTDQPTPTASIRSIGSFVCRICHNAENPERLVSPCLCKGSLTYVHIHCLERWISTSRNTTCELCQFQYNTEQTLRYTCIQSLRMWYSRSMSRRALQEDCQMFSLLTLVAFGIIGTLLVGIQYYFLQGHVWGLGRLWTKGWMVFFLFTTLVVYFVNIYMIVRSQLAPWYRWWRSARDIKLILENRKPYHLRPSRRLQTPTIIDATSSASDASELPMSPATLQQHQQPMLEQQPRAPPAYNPPTPSAAAVAADIKTSLPATLNVKLNKKAATVAAMAALDAVVYNKFARNYNNWKTCNILPLSTAIPGEAQQYDVDVNAAEVELTLDPVVYELESVL